MSAEGFVTDSEVVDTIVTVVVDADARIDGLTKLRIGRIGDFTDTDINGAACSTDDEVVDGDTVTKVGGRRVGDRRGENKPELDMLAKFTTDK